ncbi:hypothetical protein ALT_1212 [Aspergillus lentulus]|uniref:Uncharacterized protein n=1 Tax=Aspergillus lentulus TaxID=293939 RepID=A0AAN4PD76_ASPLE|nr:uncharacterized protein IFM58399_09038 [Aspergillus lentulus]KAF4186013.1 hypothetical protein CNMCM7927_006061 [Aspergillus lentulus]GAQ03891.1 hypothetical protein ALT_1212 [Aspergillus lentulus]GFF51316.1 hypothetical protein IFM58399_09038 [Aspergillus lentulus]GFF70834.1 hypothetical protein IFM62136_07937 [Aspergillus lentulus]GFF84083.1 hypothetical protein IFM47457_06356 [Aspergillus lentulus]
MQFKSLATLLFAALAVANPAPAPQAGDDLNALMDSIPSSVLGVLMTAIPPSVVAALTDPTQAAGIVQQIEQGQIPDWYNNLPDSVKAWASNAVMAELDGVAPTDTASGSPAATPTGSTTTPALTSSPSVTSSGNTKTTSSGSAGAASTTTPTSTPNAAPTGAVAVSFAGAAGILALALAL